MKKMMKTGIRFVGILGVLPILFFFVECRKSPGYRLTGTVYDRGLEGRTVYVRDPLWPEILYDSCRIVGGHFSFTGTCMRVPEVKELYVSLGSGFCNYLPVVLETGRIEVVLDSVVYAGGTPLNDRLQDFLLARDRFLDRELAGISVEEVAVRYSAFLKKRILKDRGNPVGAYIYKVYRHRLTEPDRADLRQRNLSFAY